MTVYEMFQTVISIPGVKTAAIILLLSIVEISPIKINPWSAVGGWIGKLLGISDASVSRRLSGQTDWKISEIETLCEKFDKSYCELFEIKEKESKEND
jgi:hypothetical protein